mmetsp:Transcript_11174/g.38836  ORF Transcript_11174/g.38836 Transcript_11174/m.38836 type:complete len:219 (+) Transcript_11174:212-868(+)
MEGESEIYAGELPDEVEGELEECAQDKEEEDLDTMKARLREMEEEATKLQEMQAKMEQDLNGSGSGGAGLAQREEVDTRSIFIGCVDFKATPEELQSHFQSCGTVNHVTILTDRFGNPKGYAYLEFLEASAVQNAVLLNDSELHGRKIKVAPKRTNIPGMKQGRGRGRGQASRGQFPAFNPFDPMGFYNFLPGFVKGRGKGGKGGRTSRAHGRGGTPY